jgi:hypothetical protein
MGRNVKETVTQEIVSTERERRNNLASRKALQVRRQIPLLLRNLMINF